MLRCIRARGARPPMLYCRCNFRSLSDLFEGPDRSGQRHSPRNRTSEPAISPFAAPSGSVDSDHGGHTTVTLGLRVGTVVREAFRMGRGRAHQRPRRSPVINLAVMPRSQQNSRPRIHGASPSYEASSGYRHDSYRTSRVGSHRLSIEGLGWWRR